MTPFVVYEPSPRDQWRKFYRGRRVANHFQPQHRGSAVLMLVLLGGLAFWVAAGYGLSQIL